MEQKDHIPSYPKSLVNITGTNGDSNVPVTSDSENHSSIIVETDDVKTESITVETEDVKTESITVETDDVKTESITVETDGVKTESITVETDAVKTESMTVETDDVKTKSILVETDEVKSKSILVETDEVKTKSILVETDEVKTKSILVKTDEVKTESMLVKTDEVKTESVIVETDKVKIETNVVDDSNKERNLSVSHASSSGDVGLKGNDKSDPINSSSNEKKNVSFADDQGLKLVDVRQFSRRSLPKISKAAFADLNVPENSFEEHSPKTGKGKSKFKRKTFIPMFHQPGADSRFLIRVRHEKVSLENVVINGTTVKGIIRVLNLNFQKWVQVSYTINYWETTTDLSADFVPSQSTDISTDRFEFVIYPPRMPVGARLIFYIKYVVNGREYWDNNLGFNYALECVKYLS